MGRAFSAIQPVGRFGALTTVYRVQGERYFTCKPNYGVFIRPDRVKVGDFPVEEIDFDDEEM